MCVLAKIGASIIFLILFFHLCAFSFLLFSGLYYDHKCLEEGYSNSSFGRCLYRDGSMVEKKREG